MILRVKVVFLVGRDVVRITVVFGSTTTNIDTRFVIVTFGWIPIQSALVLIKIQAFPFLVVLVGASEFDIVQILDGIIGVTDFGRLVSAAFRWFVHKHRPGGWIHA